jgi:hypothetical protein
MFGAGDEAPEDVWFRACHRGDSSRRLCGIVKLLRQLADCK